MSTVPEPDDGHLYTEQLQQPNYVTEVTVRQLEYMARNPTLKLLCNSAGFLKSQLPARLQNHLHRLQALPTPDSPALRRLLATTVNSKSRGLEVSQDWRMVPTDDLLGLQHFESHLATFREHLELEVGRLTMACRELTLAPSWWGDEEQVRWMSRLLDLNHWYLLSARVMLTQHSAALAVLEQQQQQEAGSSAARKPPVEHYHEPGHKSTDPLQPYTPPHQQLTGERPISLIRRHADVAKLVRNVSEDCRAFCIEKNSAAPDVQLRGGEGVTATLVVPYVEFVLTEVLKNAMQAVVDRYGAWEVDEAVPVTVDISEVDGTTAAGSSSASGGGSGGGGQQIQIVVTDMGNGIPPGKAAHMYEYFWTSNRPFSPLYGYSRNHGSQFKGQGVGVPMARVYTHFMGGLIEFETSAQKRHTTVTLRLPKHGFVF